MDMIQYNLFRIQLATIRESSKELDETDIEKTKEKLTLIKKNITVCEHLLGEKLDSLDS